MKQLRFNHSPFILKALRKVIMTHSWLKTYTKKWSYGNWDKCKKQRNFCVKLLRKTKQDYFNNIDIKSVSDTKKFLKTIKPHFSNKGLNSISIFNAVINSHFIYCPLTWMFSSRRSNNLINRIHKRSLKTVYDDTSGTFQELLQRNRSVSIPHKNIQNLTTEAFKVVGNICPPIMKKFFRFRENRYRIRKFQKMRQQTIRTIPYGLETAFYRPPQLCSLVPADLKLFPNDTLFK